MLDLRTMALVRILEIEDREMEMIEGKTSLKTLHLIVAETQGQILG